MSGPKGSPARAIRLLTAISDRFTGQLPAGNAAAAVAAFDYVLAEGNQLTGA